MLIWKHMTMEDLPHVLAIADVVHVAYPESSAVYEERLRLFPQGCWVAVHPDDTRVPPAGYAITHPGIVGQPPPLDSLLGTLPTQATCLYLHDVALLPAARQYGLGGALVQATHALAKKQAITQMALIAVNQSAPYWQKKGFLPYAGISPSLQHKLTSYSDDAQYLVMDVT
jgi:GNAT superfamily N-acetyltransferase